MQGKPMSYSFAVIGESKADAVAKVRAEFDRVASAHSAHAVDKEAAVAAAQAFISLLQDPVNGERIAVNMYGSVGWRQRTPSDEPPITLLSVGLTVNASIRAKEI
jgi:hypothetical protein